MSVHWRFLAKWHPHHGTFFKWSLAPCLSPWPLANVPMLAVGMVFATSHRFVRVQMVGFHLIVLNGHALWVEHGSIFQLLLMWHTTRAQSAQIWDYATEQLDSVFVE
jgi:hypothetical protein